VFEEFSDASRLLTPNPLANKWAHKFAGDLISIRESGSLARAVPSDEVYDRFWRVDATNPPCQPQIGSGASRNPVATDGPKTLACGS